MINAPTLWTAGSLALVTIATAASWGLASIGGPDIPTVEPVADGAIVARDIKDAQANVRSFLEDQRLVAAHRTENAVLPQPGRLTTSANTRGNAFRVAVGDGGWIEMDMEQRDRVFSAQAAAAELRSEQQARDQEAQREAFARVADGSMRRAAAPVLASATSGNSAASARLRVLQRLNRGGSNFTQQPDFIRQARRDRAELDRLNRDRDRRNRQDGRRDTRTR